ncbi:MAG: hypothetical protein K2P81_01080 [Bacteriovoracaceae bacterium]|nr:hypothetical protein [Bacteriovoracaceae bacterium]
MNCLVLILAIFALPLTSFGQTGSAVNNNDLAKLRGKVTSRDFGLERAVLSRLLDNEFEARVESLRDAKFFLINGETELARKTLFTLLKRDQGKLAPVLKRYLALADFQDGRWAESLIHLSSPELNAYPNYARICPLKIIVRIAVKKTFEIKNEWNRCKIENSKDLFVKDMIWMETLVNLADGAPKGFGSKTVNRYNLLNISNDDLKVILKLALYLNLENNFIDQLEGLDYSAIQDEELRAIVAHMYFRKGKLSQSWKFMEDLATPNVENMKGNLWLLRGNQELAYAQFKLALKQKSNSQNALERALPLAWSLKQWKEGYKLSDRIYAHEKNKLQKLTTTAAFAVSLENWDEAQNRLELVHQEAGEGTAQEVSQLSTYVALRKNDKKRLQRYSNRSCEGGDLTACWLLTTSMIWEDLPLVLNREDGPRSEQILWKELSSSETEAFKEESFIDQRDIDELDDSLIKLISKAQ